MRHGESEGNRGKVFTGWIDSPLTDSGRAEAESAAMSMKRAGVVFDQVFTSDLARARERGNCRCLPWRRLSAGDPLGPEGTQLRRVSGRDKEEIFREFGRERVQRWRRSYL